MLFTPDDSGRFVSAYYPDSQRDMLVAGTEAGRLFSTATDVSTKDPNEPVPVPADAICINPVDAVVVVAKVDFFRRCTDQEADEVERTVGEQGSKLRNIFHAVSTFRSDADEWPMLQAIAAGLFGEIRAAELLAPST